MDAGADEVQDADVEFDLAVQGLVDDSAPRLFAIVQVYGEREDGRVAAWGMELEDRAEVIGARDTYA
jgi:hypothetical protein